MVVENSCNLEVLVRLNQCVGNTYGSAVRSIIKGNTVIGNVYDCIDRLSIV